MEKEARDRTEREERERKENEERGRAELAAGLPGPFRHAWTRREISLPPVMLCIRFRLIVQFI